jgi:hypothetical protein
MDLVKIMQLIFAVLGLLTVVWVVRLFKNYKESQIKLIYNEAELRERDLKKELSRLSDDELAKRVNSGTGSGKD